MEIRYLKVETVIRINQEQIQIHTPKEPFGYDRGALESALQRGQCLAYYEQTNDIFRIVAAIGHGVAKAHAFRNANKRTACQVVLRMLLLNGYFLKIDFQDGVDTFEGLACDTVTQEEFAEWLRRNSIRVDIDHLIEKYEISGSAAV